MTLALALLIGIVAGLRTMTAPAAIAWATRTGGLHLEETWLVFLGWRWTPWILTVLAAAELVVDQLPQTPSRTVPSQFAARLASGALCGAAVGEQAGSWIGGLVAGLVGAVIGTFGGAACRRRLVPVFGGDRPGAFMEDIVAVGGAALVVLAL